MSIVPDLTLVNQRVSSYVCGNCGYKKRDVWAKHQLHYEAHRDEAAVAG